MRSASTRPTEVEIIDLRDTATSETLRVWLEPTVVEDGQRVCRLRSDDIDRLHEFVVAAGIDAVLVAGSVPTLTHFLLTMRQRRQAIHAGAERCDWSEAYTRIAHAVVVGTRPPVSMRSTLGMCRGSFAPVYGLRSTSTLAKTPFRRSALIA